MGVLIAIMVQGSATLQEIILEKTFIFFIIVEPTIFLNLIF